MKEIKLRFKGKTLDLEEVWALQQALKSDFLQQKASNDVKHTCFHFI